MLKWHNRAFFMKKLGTVSALCLVSVGKADPSPSHQPAGSRGRDAEDVRNISCIAATWKTHARNLIYNASLLVEDGLGYAICFDRLINTTGDSTLCVRPLVPQIRNAGNLIWKKYQVFSPAVQLFIDRVRELTG